MITVTSVEIVDEEVDVFDIEVEEDHSFLVAGVVLHNSATCIAYSRKQWSLPDKIPLGHNLPYKSGVPRHFQCRSSEIAVTKSWHELIGTPLRAADNATLDAAFREKLRAMGWEEERIQKAMLRVQSSMDGQVPADLDYQQWLKRKSAADLDDVLGKGKADLFRRGVITDLSDLVDFRGNPLTLKQLRQRHGVAMD